MTTTFYDALSQKKVKFNHRVRTPVIPPNKPGCEGSMYGHVWYNYDDDQCPCARCGATLVYVRALKNMNKEK